nr:retrovirus-related Pol polyprotein from transposon TNT 1-94 [Tanacetum cinerariifolium]
MFRMNKSPPNPLKDHQEKNTEISVSINESLVPNVPQSHISNQASTSSHLAPQDRWSKDQHIKLVNIIGDLGEGMLTRSMAAKLIAASASECLFVDILSEIEPKKKKHIRYLPNTWCKLVCWSAKKQQSVAMSSAEAEYVVAAGCCATIKVRLEIVTICPLPKYPQRLWLTVIAYDPNPSTDENKPRLLKEFLIKFTVMNGKKPLTLDFNTFTISTGLDYNNGAYVSHPSPKRELSSTEQVNFIQQLIPYSLITGTKVEIGEIIYSDLVTKLLNKSRLRYVSYHRFIYCALEALLGLEYTQDEKFRYLLGILSNSNFSKDPSKVIEIELTTHMIVTVTPTLPKSQGLEASEALPKNRKQPKPKKTPSETKVSSLKPKKGSKQSHSVSSGTVHNPQDLERNIQLTITGLPSTLDEGTCKSQHVPEGTTTDPKDSEGNDQPADRDLSFTAFDEGAAKTTPFPEGPPLLLFDDEMVQESDEDEVFTVGEDMHEDTQADTEVYPDLKKFDNILPLTERQLVKYLRKVCRVLFNKLTEVRWVQHEEAVVSYADLKAGIEGYYEENINQSEKNDKVIDAAMNSLNKNNIAKDDLLNVLNGVTNALKAIQDDVKEERVLNQKVLEAIEALICV